MDTFGTPGGDKRADWPEPFRLMMGSAAEEFQDYGWGPVVPSDSAGKQMTRQQVPAIIPLPDDIRSRVRENLPRYRGLFQELVRIPSEFEHEHAILRFLRRHLEGLGAKVHLVPHDPDRLRRLAGAQPPFSSVADRHSLVVRARGAGSGPSLALNAHLDIVSEGDLTKWRFPPFAAHIDEATDSLYGRGAMDDKAGVVIAVAVLETLLSGAWRLAGDVFFHFVIEDEVTGNGTLLCLDAGYIADAAVIIDGTRRDKAIAAHAGQLQFDILQEGKPASVSVSHLGLNAVEVLAQFLLHLRDVVAGMNAGRDKAWQPFPSPFQLVTHRLHGEGEHLTVPTRASARCHLTFPPPQTLEGMCQFLEEEGRRFAAATSLPTAPRFAWDGFATEPIEADTTILGPLLRSCAVRTGLPLLEIGPSTGTSDLRHYVRAGMPCLLYGPGQGFNPHRADEHYSLADLEPMICTYLSLTASWCGQAAGDLRRSA